MKSILLIIPYFGKWPIWFDAYLVSIAKNPTINWLIVTDCKLPKNYPENIKFVSTTLAELNNKVNTVVGANVPLTARKFCDLKPAYGDIFKEYIEMYDFWGFCDMDIVWGNIRKFITPQLLGNYDIISTLEDMISGHFTIFKNAESINTLYKKVKEHKVLFEQSKFMWFDESIFTNFLKENTALGIKVFWDKRLVDKGMKSEIQQEYFLNRWIYENGVIKDLFSADKKEYMYLHFINWKKSMKKCEVNYVDNNEQFYISFSGIHFKKHSFIKTILNNFKNLYDGYYVRLKKKKHKKSITKLSKKIKKFRINKS